MKRRQMLKATGAGLAGLGSLKAVDNVLLGYGEFGNGENLLTQDLAGAVEAHLGTAPLGDAYRFEFHTITEFFTEVPQHEVEPETVSAMRGEFASVDPELVESFTDAPVTDVEAIIYGLVDGFRDISYYDLPRYGAGAIQDNILFGAVDLREPFKSDVSFDAIATQETTRGMFCYEFTWRSIEALHAAPASEQTLPVFGGWVVDDRHKHVYTSIASVYRDSTGELVVPITFVDYTHTTLYDDLHATSVLGEGLNAYNKRHRATDIWWTL